MKKTKAVFAVFIALMMLALPAFALSLEAGTGDDFYVNDTANVLSSTTQEQIVTWNTVLEESCDEAQLVVVTVNYLDEDTDVASLQLMNDWGVGSADESNGMLLLLVSNEHRGWLSVGDGLDTVFTDDTADEYLNEYFWEYIDNDQFDEGVLSLGEALYDWYLDYYSVSDTTVYSSNSSSTDDIQTAPAAATQKKGGNSMSTLIVIIVIIVILAGVGGGGYRRGWWRRGPRPPMGGGPRPPMGGGPGPGGMGGGPRPGGMGGGPRPGGMGGGPRPGGMGGGPRPGGMGGGPRPGGMGGGPRPGGMGGGSRPGGMGGGPRGGGMGGHGGGGGGGRR